MVQTMIENDLTQSQLRLAKEIRRLCVKTHGKEYVDGWELVLFKACLGKALLATVDYGDMARLLGLFMDSGGWIIQTDGLDKFVSKDEWAVVLRTMETEKLDI